MQGFWCGGAVGFMAAGAAAAGVYVAMRPKLQDRVVVAREPPATLDLRFAADTGAS